MNSKKLKTIALLTVVCLVVVVGCQKKTEPVAPAASAAVEQTTCPIMDGNKIDKNVFVEYEGKKVYFCCPGCKAKFEADPEKYISKLPQFQK